MLNTFGMKSRASVTVMVTWVCVKESSNIQSGWREGKVNLRKTENTKSPHISALGFYCGGYEHIAQVSCPEFERFREILAVYRNR